MILVWWKYLEKSTWHDQESTNRVKPIMSPLPIRVHDFLFHNWIQMTFITSSSSPPLLHALPTILFLFFFWFFLFKKGEEYEDEQMSKKWPRKKNTGGIVLDVLEEKEKKLYSTLAGPFDIKMMSCVCQEVCMCVCVSFPGPTKTVKRRQGRICNRITRIWTLYY